MKEILPAEINIDMGVVGREMAVILQQDKTKISDLKEIILRRPVIGWVEMAAGLDD